MIDVNELRKGVTFTMDGELFRVIEYQHHKPGRGKATIRTTLRNIRTGSTIHKNFTSSDRVDDIRVERSNVQYLYTDGNLYYFMDTRTYDQTGLSEAMLGDKIQYLTEGLEVALSAYEGEALDVELPITVELEVADVEMAVAGDTATGAMKRVSLISGAQVRAPLFINVGDVLRVDTRSGEYVTRVS